MLLSVINVWSVVWNLIKKLVILYLSLCFVFLPGLSRGDNFTIVPRVDDGLLIYKPDSLTWHKVSGHPEYIYLSTASIIVNIVKCEQRYIPIKVVYVSRPLRNSYSGFYHIDSKYNSVVEFKILNFRFGDAFTRFDHIEVDSTFHNCLGNVRTSAVTVNPFILTAKTDKCGSYAYNACWEIQGKPIVFNKLNTAFMKLSSQFSYNFRGLVAPEHIIDNIEDWCRVCDPISTSSDFEKDVLGRPVVCGISNQLASIDRYILRRGDIIRVFGKVSAGSVVLIISRSSGGIVKVFLLNRGRFADDFKVVADDDYNISLFTNMSVYNFPFLDFQLSLRHVN